MKGPTSRRRSESGRLRSVALDAATRALLGPAGPDLVRACGRSLGGIALATESGGAWRFVPTTEAAAERARGTSLRTVVVITAWICPRCALVVDAPGCPRCGAGMTATTDGSGSRPTPRSGLTEAAPSRPTFSQPPTWDRRRGVKRGGGVIGSAYAKDRCCWCYRPVKPDAPQLRLTRDDSGEWYLVVPPGRAELPDEKTFGHFTLPIGPDCLKSHPALRPGLIEHDGSGR